MRIWLLALAGCWTAAPVEPSAAPRLAHVRPQITPGGYFVPNLITRRLETNAFDEGFESFAGEPAVLAVDSLTGASPIPQAVIRRRLIVTGAATVMSATAMTLSPFTAPDPRTVVQYCIDISGRVTSAHVEIRDVDQQARRPFVMPSDREALERMRGWRFAPYFVAGKPVTACSFVDYSSISS